MNYGYAEYVPIFKALADETRLKIIGILSDQEMCACKILEYFQITQPTLSYHMKILMDCGLVNGRREGTWMRYWLNQSRFHELTIVLQAITNEKAERGDEKCQC